MKRVLVRAITTRTEGDTEHKETKYYNRDGNNYALSKSEKNKSHEKDVNIHKNKELDINEDGKLFRTDEDGNDVTEYTRNGETTAIITDIVQSIDIPFKYTMTESIIDRDSSQDSLIKEEYSSNKIKVEKHYDEEKELSSVALTLYDESKNYKIYIPISTIDSEKSSVVTIDKENKTKTDIELKYKSEISTIYEDDDFDYPIHTSLIFSDENEPSTTIDYEYKRDDKNRIINKRTIEKYKGMKDNIYEDEYIYDDINNVKYQNIYEEFDD